MRLGSSEHKRWGLETLGPLGIEDHRIDIGKYLTSDLYLRTGGSERLSKAVDTVVKRLGLE